MSKLNYRIWTAAFCLCTAAFINETKAQVSYSLSTGNDTLTISGNGAMDNYADNSSNRPPWYPNRSTIKTLIIEDGVTSIGNYSFYGCALTSVSFGNSVTVIGDWAFTSACGFSSLTVPEPVTTIGEFAFYGGAFTDLTIGNSVISIGSYAFRFSYNLITVTIGNSVTTIGREAFQNSTAITTVTIGNSVTTIGRDAFNCCNKLASITIPASVTTIEYGAFAYSGLTSITIPASVTTIGNGVFASCSNLPAIDVDVNNPYYSSNDGALYNKIQDTLICYPAGKTDSVIIPNSVTTITESAFSGCSSSTTVIIPNSVTSIGKEAFEYFKGFSIIIPNSITKIESGTFSYCRQLTSVTIPNSVTTIGNYAFRFCVSLPTVNIPSSVTLIDTGAFYHCDNLTDINIPNSVTVIRSNTFSNCYNLTIVTIPNSVTAIESNAFYQCVYLTTISIPSSVTAMGTSMFYDCSNLAHIYSARNTPPTAYNNGTFNGINKATCILHVPAGRKSVYASANGWKEFTRSQDDLVTVTVSATPVAGGTVTGGRGYSSGNTVSVEAFANPHYTFLNWTVNGAVVSTANPYTFTVTKDTALVANFELNRYAVTVSANSVAGGTVTGGRVYNAGETASVSATPNAEYIFVNWTVNGIEVSTANPYSFTVTEEVELTANFALKTYTITVEDDGNGTGTANPNIAPAGTPISLTATPANSGYVFDRWEIIDGVAINNNEFTMPNRNVIIKATFKEANDFVQTLHATSPLNVYPNPTNGILHIVAEDAGATNALPVQIYDIYGREIVNCQLSIVNSIDISHLENGLYFLKIGNKTVKIIKN